MAVLRFVFPNFAFAQDNSLIVEHSLLSQLENWQLLNALQLSLIDGNNLSDFLMLNGKDQAAISILRGTIRQNFLRFLPGFVSTETVKIVIKLATEIKNLPTESVGDLIGRFENLTAKEAAKAGLDWLSQNEIKVSSGNLDDQQTGIRFQYIMTYQDIDRNHARIEVEFYSSNSINPPPATESVSAGAVYFAEDLPQNGKIPPFILHVEAQMNREGLGWAVKPKTAAKEKVEFPDRVPRLELSPDLPYPLEEQKINLLNYLNTLKGIATTLGITGSQAWQRISKIADAAQEVIKKIEFIQTFISQFTPKNAGSGIVLQVPESPAAKTSSRNKASNKEIASQAKTASKNSSAISKNAETKDNPLQEVVQKQQQAPAKEIAQTGLPANEVGPPAPAGAGGQEKTAHSCAVFSGATPQQNSVIFNEVAWMGTSDSPSNEWMELKNISGLPISLAGWQIANKNEKIKIDFGNATAILSGQFFLLERTDDSSVPYIAADLIYSNAISNAKDELYLFDGNCVMRDKIAANPNWPAGDSSQKRSMERWADLSWHTYGGALQGGVYGTPKAENISNGPVFLNVVSGIGSGGGTSTADASGKKAYSKILISEVQIAGIDSQTEEFVELYNPTDSDVNLTDWHIQKKTKSAASFSTFVSSNSFSGKTIKALGYFLIARANSSFAGSADITTQSSLGEDNTLVLKNPNQEIADKLGLGASQDFETQAAQNPPAGKSIGRKYQSGSYTDTDDNSKDFQIQNPTPKLVNENYVGEVAPPQAAPLSSGPADATPPTVVFSALLLSQLNTSFVLSWVGEDPLGDADASPSGLDGFYLQYSVTPSADGIFLQYENNGALTAWNQGQTGELNFSPSTSAVTVSAQDGVGYLFSLKAKDKAANQSVAAAVSTEVALSKTVVINEIAWAGTKSSTADEWIELANNTASQISIEGWKLKSSDSSGPSIVFTNAAILPNSISASGFYLIERTDDKPTSELANWKGSFGNGLSNTDCEVLSLYDSRDNLIDQSACNDGKWPAGKASPNYISMERIDSTKGGTNASNWADNNLIKHNGRDVAGNFVNGTPKQENSVSVASTQISDLRFSEFGNSLTLPLRGSPYFAYDITVPENATLAIDPGVTIKFKNNYAQFIVDGTLKAAGSSEKKITFTTDSNSGGPWCGLSFSSKSKNSYLEYVVIEQASRSTCGGVPVVHYAMLVDHSDITFRNSSITKGNGIHKLYLKGSNSLIDAITISGATYDQNSSAVFIDGGSPTIQNSTFSNNSIGIFSTSVTALPGKSIIKNNTFSQNTYPIRFNNPSISLSGNTATQNTHNGIYVDGEVSYADAVWQADLPYIVESFTVNAGKKLTLQEGVTIQFANLTGGNREIIVNGTLAVQGTAEKPATFTIDGSVSDWRRIDFAPGSAGSILQNAIIQNGGSPFNGNGGTLYVETSDVQIQNVAMTLQSNEYGFYIGVSSCPTLSSVTVQGGTIFSPAGKSCPL